MAICPEHVPEVIGQIVALATARTGLFRPSGKVYLPPRLEEAEAIGLAIALLPRPPLSAVGAVLAVLVALQAIVIFARIGRTGANLTFIRPMGLRIADERRLLHLLPYRV